MDGKHPNQNIKIQELKTYSIAGVKFGYYHSIDNEN